MLTKKMLSYASCEVEAFLPTGPFDQYRKTIKHLLNICTEKASRGTQDKVGFAALVERVFDNENPSRQFENTN